LAAEERVNASVRSGKIAPSFIDQALSVRRMVTTGKELCNHVICLG